MDIVGRRLGDFRVDARLDAGGFGVVYAAVQASLGRAAVIKVIAGGGRPSAAAAERFAREARIAAALDHPYGAHVYAFGIEDDGLRWLAMERVCGTSLEALLAARGPMAPAQFVPLFERLCEVVCHAHERGIVHRDLKPANVMVIARAGRLLPKVLDFGIAAMSGDAAVTPPGAVPALDLDAPAAPLTGPGPLGSPHYMAPEQWTDPHEATARADVYALAALAYQALTGRRPFEGATLRALAQAHAAGPPPVGAHLPAAVDEVMRAALRVDVAGRTGSALALAGQLRRALGVVDPPSWGLPEELGAAAPRPILDGLAALAGAGAAPAAGAAVARVARPLLRYLVLVAAAARGAQVGVTAVRDRLLGLARHDDAAWASAGAALVAEAGARESFPVPEVIDALAPGDSGVVAGALAALAAVERGDVTTAVAALGRALVEVQPVFAYRVVARRGAAIERWDGVSHGGQVPRAIDGLGEGEVALVDADGVPRVRCGALALVRVPAVGVAPALFFLDGHDGGWLRYVAWPSGFEHRAALAGDPPATGGVAPEASPFVGLASFTTADAACFVGREPEVDAVLNLLRAQPVVVVVGPSGIGKTSFVQAGVIPALPPGWRAVVLRPGPRPRAALAAALATCDLAAGAAAAETGHREVAVTWVIVVEQLEELFTLAPAAERAEVAAALHGLISTGGSRVRVLMTLRDDFLMRAQELGLLWESAVAGLTLLSRPSRAALIRILTTPVRQAGYRFEEPSLVDEVVDVVATRAGALLLLQFAAARWWERRDRARRVLTRAAYDELGGVAGALAGHADAVVAGCAPAERGLVRAAFRQLVTDDGTRAVRSRDELREALASPRTDAVIERLVAARLLIVSDGPAGQAIELIHEALLREWPQLVAWQREDVGDVRLRDQVRIAARQWRERGRAPGLLWRDDALAEVRRWRARVIEPMTAVEAAFVAASEADQRRRGWRRRGAVVAAIAALAIGAAALMVVAAQARRARAVAEQRQTQQLVEQGRQAVIADDGQAAVAYLRAARARGADDAGLPTMLAHAERLVLARWFDRRVDSDVQAVAWSPDGRRFAVGEGDGDVTLWQADGTRLAELRRGGAAVLGLRFSPDGAQLAVRYLDQIPQLFAARPGARPVDLVGLGGAPDDEHRGVDELEFSPSGGLIAAAARNGTVGVWAGRGGGLIATIAPRAPAAHEVLWDRAGRLLVGDDLGLRLFDVATPAHPTLVASVATPAPCLCAGFVDGDRRVVASLRGGVAIAELATGQVVRHWQLAGRAPCAASDPAGGIAIVEDPYRVVMYGDDGERRWSATTDARLFAVRIVGPRVIAGTTGGTVRVWERASGRPVVTHKGLAETVYAIAAHPDAGSVLATSTGGSVARLSIDAAAPSRSISRATLALAVAEPEALIGVATDGFWAEPGAADPPWAIAEPVLAAVAPAQVAVVVAGAPSRLVVVDRRSGRAWPLAHDGDHRVIAIADDGTLVAARRTPTEVDVSMTASGQARARITTTSPVASLRFAPDGATLVVGTDAGQAWLWSLPEGRAIASLAGHASTVRGAAFSADGTVVYTASADGTVRSWRRADGRPLATFSGHQGELFAVAVDAAGRVAAAGQGGVWVHAPGGDVLAHPIRQELSVDVAWLPEGERLAARTAGDGQVTIAQFASWPTDAQAVTCRLTVTVDPAGRLVARVPPPCPPMRE